MRLFKILSYFLIFINYLILKYLKMLDVILHYIALQICCIELKF